MPETLVDFCCGSCGSRDVAVDAFARWNVRTQQWECADTFEKGAWCNACDGEARIISIEINEADRARILADNRHNPETGLDCVSAGAVREREG